MVKLCHVVERKSKILYKLEILALKVLPMLISLLYCIGTVLDLVGIDVTFITYLSGMSIIPLLFMYLSSHVFRFCSYHRIFLHYILFNIVINCIDWYIGIPLNNKEYLSVFLVITCLFLFAILYSHQKSRRDE